MKKKKRQLYVLYGILAAFLLTAVFAIYMMLSIPDPETGVLEQYDEYDEYQEIVTITTPVPTPEQVPEEEPIEETFGINYDYEVLKGENSDFAAWLMIPNTPVSFPVVYSTDNWYYLYYSFNGTYSIFGCPFFDMATEGTDNRVIHGHNIINYPDKMFSPLLDYQDQEFADSNKYIYLSESEGVTEKYQVFAVINFKTYWLDECNYMRTSFETEEERTEYIKYLMDKSVYTADFFPEGDILILSTCNRADGGAENRLLVCTSKVEE